MVDLYESLKEPKKYALGHVFASYVQVRPAPAFAIVPLQLLYACMEKQDAAGEARCPTKAHLDFLVQSRLESSSQASTSLPGG